MTSEVKVPFIKFVLIKLTSQHSKFAFDVLQFLSNFKCSAHNYFYFFTRTEKVCPTEKISHIGAPFLKVLNNLGYSNICVKLNNNNFLYFFGHTVNKTESADVCYFYKLKLYTLSDNIFPLIGYLFSM